MTAETPLDVEAIRARLEATASIDYVADEQTLTDLRRLLDENARLNAELESLRVHNGTLVTEIRFQAERAEEYRAEVHRQRAELDRVIREAAADKAKLAAALAHIRECMHIGLQDAKLYDEAGRKRIGEWADFIDKQIYAALDAAPEMPRPPAVKALGAVEPSNADTSRGTGVREAHARSEAAIAAIREVWTSCDCDEDLSNIAEAARPVHYREAANSLRTIAAGRISTAPDALAYARAQGLAEAADLLDSVARDLDGEGT